MGDLSKESVRKAIATHAAVSQPSTENEKFAPLHALRSLLRNIAEKTEATYDPNFTAGDPLPKCKDVVDETLSPRHQNSSGCRR